jgi:hypothetical protein
MLLPPETSSCYALELTSRRRTSRSPKAAQARHQSPSDLIKKKRSFSMERASQGESCIDPVEVRTRFRSDTRTELHTPWTNTSQTKSEGSSTSKKATTGSSTTSSALALHPMLLSTSLTCNQTDQRPRRHLRPRRLPQPLLLHLNPR